MGNILQFARCQTFMPCPKTAEPVTNIFFLRLLPRRKMRRPHLTTVVCHDVQRQKLTVVFIYVPTPSIITST